MLERGDTVPHFEVRTFSGDVFRYATIWQRRNLVLLILPDPAAGASYRAALSAAGGGFREPDTEYVMTRDDLPGLDGPAALVADKWGEIVYVATTSRVEDLPSPKELLDWLEYVERRCPECEGEAK